MKGRPAASLLPVELWELVLDEGTSDTLLVWARVCRLLNELAIHMYLHRTRTTPTDGTLDIRSHLIRVLFASVCDPPLDVSKLRVGFWTFGNGPGILMLHEIVKRWPRLSQIQLNWQLRNVLGFAMREERQASGRKRIPAPVYLDGLWKLTLAVAERHSKSFVVVGGGQLCRCSHAEFARGHLAYAKEPFDDSDGWRPPLQRLLDALLPWVRKGRFRSRPYFSLHVGLSSEIRISHIDGLAVRPLPDGWDATLIEFDMDMLLLQPNPTLSAEEISALLPHIYLSNLSTLEVASTDIDPEAMRNFLDRHPRLSTIRLACPWTTTKPICVPTVRGNWLHLVSHAEDVAASFGALLDAFSSGEAKIETTLRRATATQRESLAGFIRRLQASGRTFQLRLELPPDLDDLGAPPVEGEELAALQDLRCVSEVYLFANHVRNLRAVIPWLAAIPSPVLQAVRCWRREGTLSWEVSELRAAEAAIQSAVPHARVQVRA